MPRNTELKAWGGRGEHGEAHHGGNGDGGGSETAIRAEGRSANLDAAAVVVSVHGERERERGNSRGARGKARLLFNRAEEREGGGTLPRRMSWATVAAAPGAGGCRAARGRRRRRQVGPRRQRLGKEARQRLLDGRRKLGWSGAGPAQMLGRVARKGGRLSWAAGRRWASGRKRAENKEGKGETDSFLFFFYTFPNPFLNSNFNSF